jgi:hypothetical protein
LVLGEKPAIKEVGPLALQVNGALDFGLEGLADLIEKIRQGSVIRSLLDGCAG